MNRSMVLALLLPVSCAGELKPRGELRDFRGIIHCHTKYSHDSKGTYEEILAAAKAAKVDFVCITDHPPKGDAGLSLREGWTGLHDGVLFIQGHELAGANLLAIGIREPVASGPVPERIEAIRRKGGVSIVSHPEEVVDWEPYLGADGMEIFNVHAAFKAKMKDLTFLATMSRVAKQDPESSFKLLQELDPAILQKYDEIARSRRFTVIAGNDSHQNVLNLDPYPRAFRFVSTHVMARELTEKAVLDALREGNSYVAFDLLRPIQLGDAGKDGGPSKESSTTRIYSGGRLVMETPGAGFPDLGGGGRVEWWLKDGAEWRPWALFGRLPERP